MAINLCLYIYKLIAIYIFYIYIIKLHNKKKRFCFKCVLPTLRVDQQKKKSMQYHIKISSNF